MKKSIILLILLIMTSCIVSCGQNKKGAGETDTTYIYNTIQLDMDRNCTIYQSYLKDNCLYYAYRIEPDFSEDFIYDSETMSHDEFNEKYSEGEYEYVSKLGKFDIENGEKKDICEIKEDASDPGALFVSNDDKIILINNYDMIIKSMAGEDIATVSLLKSAIAQGVEDFGFDIIKYGSDGNLYTAGGENGRESILRFDPTGALTGKIYFDKSFDDMVFDNNGNVVIGSRDGDGITYYYVDFENGKVSAGVTLSNEEGVYYFGDSMSGTELHRKGIAYMFDGAGDVTFYLKDSSGLYAYNAESGAMSLCLDWMETGIIGGYVSDIRAVGDDRLYCMCDDHALHYTYGFIERSDKTDSGKTVIRCAALNSEGVSKQELQQRIIDYNMTSSDIKVEYVSYDKSSNPISDFAKDVIAGNIPDVLDISSIDIYEYAGKGFFEDLTPYIESDDTLNKDYFVPDLLDATCIDGKQYYVFNSFDLDTVAAKASDVQNTNDGWTMKELIDYYHSKPKGTKLYYYESKMDVFNELIAPDIERYINRNTGEVSFNSDEFREAVSFCNEFPDISEDYEAGGTDFNSVHDRIRDGKILLNTMYLSVDEYQMNEHLFDDDIAFIGYPSDDGKGSRIRLAAGTFAITSSSEKKDAAWEFIKSLILNEKEDENNRHLLYSGRERFEKELKRISATEKYTETDGTVITPLRGTASVNDFSFEIVPFTEDKLQVIRDLVKNSRVEYNDSAVLDIVCDELKGYFDGTRSLDEVIALIQDRMTKYVNENK